jgi:long-subunit acyl-CoA synthetase (AMP-forming)
MKLAALVARLRDSHHTLTLADDAGVETVRTFHDLYVDTLAVVDRLRALGAVPGCRIGLCAPSHYAFMAWDLACLAIGAISVTLPNERPAAGADLGELIERYRLTLLAIEPSWRPVPACRDDRLQRLVDLDPTFTAPLPRPREAVDAVPADDRPGTHSLVFSSGTTGKTKGLVISAAGTEHLLDLYHDAFGVAPGERFLTFLPFANYQQRMVYYFCLWHGVDFVSVPFPQLFAGLKKHRPTFTIAPPILYESLHTLARASVGPQRANDPDALRAKLHELLGGRVRYLITGMAPIRRATLDFFWTHGLALYEAFGITEAGMVAWNKPGAVRVGTVGRPAEAGSVTLSDEGEVIVTRPDLLSFGYFESSEEDAANTFRGPHAVATGDIAAFDGDGYLTVIGRKKDAIITRNGEKFHPEPIEHAIHGDPRVGVAVVLPSDRAGLAAVISTRHHADPAAVAALRAHVDVVNATLPAQQQVRHLVFTERDFTVENGLRTRNLKLNRRAIAAAFLAEA